MMKWLYPTTRAQAQPINKGDALHRP